MEDVVVPICFFAALAAIILVPVWLKSRERRQMQDLLRVSLDKGQPLPAEVIDALSKNVKTPPTSFGDIRVGVVWLAIGLGVAAFGFMIGFRHEEAFHPLIGIGMIPAIIGLAYIALGFFNPNKGNQA
ncbi:MAG: hypothetical protein KA105_09530 [Caulobacter sp.]|jgi:hypothetical protein|nr:hypothetical protein [Caulobacter sp.]